MNNQHTICFVAGRSGGHLVPCLTLAYTFLKNNPTYKVMLFSTTSQLDATIVSNSPTIHHYIQLSLHNVPYKNLRKYPYFIFSLAAALFKSFYYLYKYKPQKIISMGGYISIPVCIAAWLLRIPIQLYELNAAPGKAARFLAPLAHKIFVVFQQAQRFFPAKKCSITSYPIRFSDNINNNPNPSATRNLSSNKKTVLILGGSQGSAFINNLIKQWLEHNHQLHNAIQLIHQIGADNITDWQAYYNNYCIPAIVFDYQHNLEQYYRTADLIICRSGAGTLFEIQFFKKLCITIPHEATTTSHQINNAYAMAEQYPQLFTVIKQSEIKHNPSAFFIAMQQHLFTPTKETDSQNCLQQ